MNTTISMFECINTHLDILYLLEELADKQYKPIDTKHYFIVLDKAKNIINKRKALEKVGKAKEYMLKYNEELGKPIPDSKEVNRYRVFLMNELLDIAIMLSRKCK